MSSLKCLKKCVKNYFNSKDFKILYVLVDGENFVNRASLGTPETMTHMLLACLIVSDLSVIAPALFVLLQSLHESHAKSQVRKQGITQRTTPLLTGKLQYGKEK